MSHFAVHLKLTQHCKSIRIQLKKMTPPPKKKDEQNETQSKGLEQQSPKTSS